MKVRTASALATHMLVITRFFSFLVVRATNEHLWKNWRQVLIIVKPETVIKLHRQGFKIY
jgi:hypothetical protein